MRGRGLSSSGRGPALMPAVTRSASWGEPARGGITQRGGRGSESARGRGTRGGRSSTLTPATTSSVPTANTIIELRLISYAFTVNGEFPGVAHKDERHIHSCLHGISVRCGNNATGCSTDNQGSAGHARSRPVERRRRTRYRESQIRSSFRACSALCRLRWTEANQFEMGFHAQGERLLQGSCTGSTLEPRFWP